MDNYRRDSERDYRLPSFTALILRSMFDIDWWRRPSAKQLAEVLKSVSVKITPVFVIGNDLGEFDQPIYLAPSHRGWREVQWNLCWYHPNWNTL